MKRFIIAILLAAGGSVFQASAAQQKVDGNNQNGYAPEVYTGTIINTSGGMVTTGFTLTINSRTSDEEAQRELGVLADGGQDSLLRATYKNNLGFIAATGQTRRNLLVVREGMVNGQRRIIAAFERWQGFFEVRGGYRSTDYPFSIIEIYFDEKGRGTGTFIGLAQLRMGRGKNTELPQLEIEDFGSYPAKVMGVMRRK